MPSGLSVTVAVVVITGRSSTDSTEVSVPFSTVPRRTPCRAGMPAASRAYVIILGELFQ